jgi:hypothetical protein
MSTTWMMIPLSWLPWLVGGIAFHVSAQAVMDPVDAIDEWRRRRGEPAAGLCMTSQLLAAPSGVFLTIMGEPERLARLSGPQPYTYLGGNWNKTWQ